MPLQANMEILGQEDDRDGSIQEGDPLLKRHGSISVRQRFQLWWHQFLVLIGKELIYTVSLFFKSLCRCFISLVLGSALSPLLVTPPADQQPRTIFLNKPLTESYRPNVIRNQKYSVFSFIPLVLFEQFKFFFNFYFLCVSASQFIPILQVGFLFTYVAPLGFVLAVTLLKEAYDDFQRFLRDKEANGEQFTKLTHAGEVAIPASEIKVGDWIVVEKDQRIPADMVFMKTSEVTGASFIRTDQLDGETDWKLRLANPETQHLSDGELLRLDAEIFADTPIKDIYQFIGTYTEGIKHIALTADNALWSNTVLASGRIVGLVIYTGKDTRSAINTNNAVTKTGHTDRELNTYGKALFVLLVLLSLLMVVGKGFQGIWYIYLFRFLLLFSAIIPISLRVNLDMAKTLYSFLIMRGCPVVLISDPEIPETIVRTSTLPEELGRVAYLLSDKTGTLTQNDMIFKKLHLGTISFSKDTLDDVESNLTTFYKVAVSSLIFVQGDADALASSEQHLLRVKRNLPAKVHAAVLALALCHNVTPVEDGFQASSPDEIALVKFAQSVGLSLVDRDLKTITLRNALGQEEKYEVLRDFPFTSETKRMGIILRNLATEEILFLMKGADAVMADIVKKNDWLEEEATNMAREGLRTLVFGARPMQAAEYEHFAQAYAQAKATVVNRDENVQAVVVGIEHDLDLIALTGVEDKLQVDVRSSLETMRNAGIKVWMLTGDKIETAKVIATSAKLVSRSQRMFDIVVSDAESAAIRLHEFSAIAHESALVIDGRSLAICFENCIEEFVQTATLAPAVVCCRCSPTQKAEVVKLIKSHTKKITCAIGDGGNDVSMILAADVGLGIVGKEGKQASLAADFSIPQFSHITKLLLWHGRNSFQRTARLAQFVIHRGLIISVIQAVFSAVYFFAAVPIYDGWLLVGYATFYTMMPVFSLVLDEDVRVDVAKRYPELYKELQKGRILSAKTFTVWVLKSTFQGGLIMLSSLFLFENAFINTVSITFTALILAELMNIGFEIRTWHWAMVVSELGTLIVYIISIIFLPMYFDITFIASWDFVWKLAVVVGVSCLPVYVIELVKRKVNPPSYTKLRHAA